MLAWGAQIIGLGIFVAGINIPEPPAKCWHMFTCLNVPPLSNHNSTNTLSVSHYLGLKNILFVSSGRIQPQTIFIHTYTLTTYGVKTFTWSIILHSSSLLIFSQLNDRQQSFRVQRIVRVLSKLPQRKAQLWFFSNRVAMCTMGNSIDLLALCV